MDAIDRWLAALESSALGEAARQSLWLYPIANVVHVFAVAILFGMLVLTDLRLLGRFANLPEAALLDVTLPFVWAGFAVAAASGAVLFAADPQVIARSPLFQMKLVLIAAAGINAGLFHWVARRRGLRILAAFSLILWSGIILCGRWIAYA